MGFLDRFNKKENEHHIERKGKELGAPAGEEQEEDFDIPPEVLVKPGGMKLEFLVKPNLTEEDQEKLKRGILYGSGLIRYYRYSTEFEENFKIGKIRVKINCVEPLVPVEKSEETDFYHDVKNFFSEWMVEALKSIGYDCELHDWSYDKKGKG